MRQLSDFALERETREGENARVPHQATTHDLIAQLAKATAPRGSKRRAAEAMQMSSSRLSHILKHPEGNFTRNVIAHIESYLATLTGPVMADGEDQAQLPEQDRLVVVTPRDQLIALVASLDPATAREALSVLQGVLGKRWTRDPADGSTEVDQ